MGRRVKRLRVVRWTAEDAERIDSVVEVKSKLKKFLSVRVTPCDVWASEWEMFDVTNYRLPLLLISRQRSHYPVRSSNFLVSDVNSSASRAQGIRHILRLRLLDIIGRQKRLALRKH